MVDPPGSKEAQARAARKQSFRAMHRADEAAKITAYRANAIKAQEQFDGMFSHDEKKVIMAHSFWKVATDKAEEQRSTSGCLKHASLFDGVACGKSLSTVHDHMTDWRNNGGWFSESLWGKNTKMASLLGDVDVISWARSWVIDNMGHVKGRPNKKNADFNLALHGHLGLEFYADVKQRIIKPGASLALLKKTGARWTEHKTGQTFHDSHGADHVANGQRPAFLSLYAQLYARGPNFVRVPGSTAYVDKDTIPNCRDFIDKDPACLGPRGINLGGAPNPNNAGMLLPFCKSVAREGKVRIVLCHDECCIHSLKEEQHCWLIPGVEMGEMSTKSDGEILHLSEADAEISLGCLSLSGTIGRTTRVQMKEYIRAKRAGENPRIPHHSSVWMHAGKGSHQEGS